MCPKGDDPVSSFHDYRSITITTSIYSGYLGGNFRLDFNDQTLAFPANGHDWSSSSCKETLQGLPNVGIISCTQGTVSLQGETSYVITFQTWPVYPFENNIRTNDGNPLLSDFECDVAYASGAGPGCVITDTVAVVSLPGSYYYSLSIGGNYLVVGFPFYLFHLYFCDHLCILFV